MTLDKFDQVRHLEVYEPRWHDKKALLACYKVDDAKTDHIKITFPKSKAMAGDWYVSRKVARKFKKQSNGVIMCYVVPLEKLEPLEISERSRYE